MIVLLDLLTFMIIC